jgi:hypothetical protein
MISIEHANYVHLTVLPVTAQLTAQYAIPDIYYIRTLASKIVHPATSPLTPHQLQHNVNHAPPAAKTVQLRPNVSNVIVIIYLLIIHAHNVEIVVGILTKMEFVIIVVQIVLFVNQIQTVLFVVIIII